MAKRAKPKRSGAAQSKKSASENREVPVVSDKIAFWNEWEASQRISVGLSTRWLETVQEALDLSTQELGHTVQISARTLSRRKNQELLSPDESERVYRIWKLVQLAADVFGDLLDARNWMKEPNFSLAEKTPIEVARTEPGAAIITRLLEQIRYGIAS